MQRRRLSAGIAGLAALSFSTHAIPASPVRHGSVVPEIQRLIGLDLPVYCGGPQRREVALTFDDGPGPYTLTALRILRRAHDPATFFLVGRLLAHRSSLVRREAQIGDVGDHTWTHRDLAVLPPLVARQEIGRTARALRELTGRRVVFFRPPYGVRSPTVDSIARGLHLLEVLWSIDSFDWKGADPAHIAANVEKARPGSIVLMHENRGQTLKALLWQHALAVLRARRLRAVTLTRLMTTDPPTRAQLVKGVRGCATNAQFSRGG